ncbi:hypothetical protein DMUE_6224, partial [Dictyocoela muelleri]
VYIFMKTKSKNSYKKALNFLKSKMENENIYKITFDFEMSALMALKDVFPDSIVNGCFFHFTQLLFRSIQRLVLVGEYKRNANMREVFRMIVALSFVPLKEIEKEFYKLDLYLKSTKDMHKMLDFTANFENTYGKYISGEYSDISIYSPQFWSVYERVKNDL